MNLKRRKKCHAICCMVSQFFGNNVRLHSGPGSRLTKSMQQISYRSVDYHFGVDILGESAYGMKGKAVRCHPAAGGN